MNQTPNSGQDGKALTEIGKGEDGPNGTDSKEVIGEPSPRDIRVLADSKEGST